jgi:hypothetical protein
MSWPAVAGAKMESIGTGKCRIKKSVAVPEKSSREMPLPDAKYIKRKGKRLKSPKINSGRFRNGLEVTYWR